MNWKEFFKPTKKRVLLYISYTLIPYWFFKVGFFMGEFFSFTWNCFGPPGDLACHMYGYLFGNKFDDFLSYSENATFLGLPHKFIPSILLYLLAVYLILNFVTYKYKENRIVYFVILIIPIVLILEYVIVFIFAALTFRGFGL